MSFRDNLKSEMEFQDIQLKELASKTGISKFTLANYLTGHHSLPNADSAVKIARVLGVTVEYLVTGKESEKKPNLLTWNKEIAHEISMLPTEKQKEIKKLILGLIRVAQK